MDQKFILTMLGLQELKELGYKEVWIGRVNNPHWPDHPENGIIASPKRKKGGWPAIWSSERYFGSTLCGNGLPKADQCFKAHVRNMMPGHYRLEDEAWKKMD